MILCRSLDLLVKELNGKNYSLVIKNLAEVIDASKSHWKVKSGKKTFSHLRDGVN